MKEISVQVLEKLLGTTDLATYLAAFIFALIGAVVALRLRALKRDKASENTPVKFSWKFLLQDNLSQLLTGILLTFLAFRFTNEFLGKDLTMWLAVFIGGANDEIALRFKRLQEKARTDLPVEESK